METIAVPYKGGGRPTYVSYLYCIERRCRDIKRSARVQDKGTTPSYACTCKAFKLTTGCSWVGSSGQGKLYRAAATSALTGPSPPAGAVSPLLLLVLASDDSGRLRALLPPLTTDAANCFCVYLKMAIFFLLLPGCSHLNLCI